MQANKLKDKHDKKNRK